jgi:hypothetical protein
MSNRGAAGSPFAALWVIGACALGALLVWWSMPPEVVERFMGETGPVERLTAASYAACAIAIWWARVRGDDRRTTAAAAAVLLAFAARELDWHRTFTGTSVLRVSWYGGPASLGAKVLAAGVLAAVLLALAWLLLRHGRAMWRGWRQRRPIAVTMLLFAATLLLAKSLDRSVAILVEDFGVPVSLSWKALRTAFEEWLELALSLLVALALWQRREEHRRHPPSHDG